MIQKYDAIIIGTGQSGPYLAKSLCQKGYNVAIIEQAHFGGTCINTGCTPTKTLVANAKIVHSVRQAKIFGINIDQFQIDYKVIKERKDALVKAGTEWVKNSLQSTKGCTILEGHASFEGPHRIKVGETASRRQQDFHQCWGSGIYSSVYPDYKKFLISPMYLFWIWTTFLNIS